MRVAQAVKLCIIRSHIERVTVLPQTHQKLLWVVRPCLWLQLKATRGLDLFPVCGATLNSVAQTYSSLFKVAFYQSWAFYNMVYVSLISAIVSLSLRLFIPHLCHAACRIVVMAEDTKSVLGVRCLR